MNKLFTIEYRKKTFDVIDIMEDSSVYYFLVVLDKNNRATFTKVLDEMGKNVESCHLKLVHLYTENYKGCRGLVPYDLWAEGVATIGRFYVDSWKTDVNKLVYESIKK